MKKHREELYLVAKKITFLKEEIQKHLYFSFSRNSQKSAEMEMLA